MANAIGTRTPELRVGCDHRSDTSDGVTKIQVTVMETVTEKEEETHVIRPPPQGGEAGFEATAVPRPPTGDVPVRGSKTFANG